MEEGFVPEYVLKLALLEAVDDVRYNSDHTASQHKLITQHLEAARCKLEGGNEKIDFNTLNALFVQLCHPAFR